jgi:O-antigen/teichoic acid export membrane protein
MRGLSAMFVLMAIYVLPESMLERDLRFREKTAAELAATLTSMLTALAIALAGGGVWALVGSILMLHLTKAVLFNAMVRMPLVPRWSMEALRPFVRYGSIVMLAQIAHYLFSSADIAIGGRSLGKELLGLYVVTLTVVSVPLDKFMPAVTKVSFAAFSRIQAEPDRVVRNVLRGVRLSSLLAFPFYFGLAVIAPECIPLILGDKWAGIVPPLQILCLVFPLRTVAAILPPALYAVGRPGVNLANVLIALVLMSVAFLLGVQNGVVGLATAWAIAYPLVFLISSARGLRALVIPARSFAGAVLPAAAAGAVMGSAVALLRVALPIGNVPAQLAVVIVLGTLVYAGVLYPMRRFALADLEVVFRRNA